MTEPRFETRFPDHRLYARPVRQNVPRLPLVPTETPLMRARRLRRQFGHALILVAAALLAAALTPLT
ncbi:MAG: hypothetical protein ACK4MT_05740 [Thermaurantiacus tibetensis]|uniref:hypothetical protein n=1 Tax=Thermaurantiacus tibetensis TaxID=2759035 RepID=UPI00188F84E7|nr:hypothetical protein [Thermaurantiacus tibetensis]